MMKIYLKKLFIIKNVFKSFSIEGKLKSKETNSKPKNYSVLGIFEEEKNDENNTVQSFFHKNFLEEIIEEQNEKINDIPENIKENKEIHKEYPEQPLINFDKSKLKEIINNKSYDSNNVKPNNKQSNDHEKIIDKMLSQKMNSYQPYSYNNPNNKIQNSNQTTNLNVNLKRQKMSFVREGMILSLSLKKPSNTSVSGKNDGYLYLELKEYNENYSEEKKLRDPRFLVLNPINCAKLMLLDPKSCNPNELQLIKISIKNRIVEIEQNKDKTYTLIITITNDNSEVTEIPEHNINKITSRIELNPEDIILLQKFVNKCIDELLIL